jgi:parallel beta-helix repeat protein
LGTSSALSYISFDTAADAEGPYNVGGNAVKVNSNAATFSVTNVTFNGQFNNGMVVSSGANNGTISSDTFLCSYGTSDLTLSGANHIQLNSDSFNVPSGALGPIYCVYGPSADSTISISNSAFIAADPFDYALWFDSLTQSTISSNAFGVRSGSYDRNGALYLQGNTNNVLFTGNSCTSGYSQEGGAVTIGSSNVRNVQITNNTIALLENPNFHHTSLSSGVAIQGGSGITVSGNTISGTAYGGVYGTNCSNITVTNNTFQNNEGAAVYFDTGMSGTCNISNNTTAGDGYLDAADAAFVYGIPPYTSQIANYYVAASSIGSLKVQNNVDSGPANNFSDYIDILIPAANVSASGNMTPTNLPSVYGH